MLCTQPTQLSNNKEGEFKSGETEKGNYTRWELYSDWGKEKIITTEY